MKVTRPKMPVPRFFIARRSNCGIEPGTGDDASGVPWTDDPSVVDSHVGPL
jgi:hypothetical protein